MFTHTNQTFIITRVFPYAHTACARFKNAFTRKTYVIWNYIAVDGYVSPPGRGLVNRL